MALVACHTTKTKGSIRVSDQTMFQIPDRFSAVSGRDPNGARTGDHPLHTFVSISTVNHVAVGLLTSSRFMNAINSQSPFMISASSSSLHDSFHLGSGNGAKAIRVDKF